MLRKHREEELCPSVFRTMLGGAPCLGEEQSGRLCFITPCAVLGKRRNPWQGRGSLADEDFYRSLHSIGKKVNPDRRGRGNRGGLGAP
eukprot:scaffold27492_cov16-Tisochrysis_lutea.AAC.1